MTSKRAIRVLAATAVATAISLGAAAPAGFAQDYGESPPPGTTSGIGGQSGSGDSNAALRKKCIAKAQTKFGDNKPKRKAAIRKCKKKYRV